MCSTVAGRLAALIQVAGLERLPDRGEILLALGIAKGRTLAKGPLWPSVTMALKSCRAAFELPDCKSFLSCENIASPLLREGLDSLKNGGWGYGCDRHGHLLGKVCEQEVYSETLRW